MPELYSQVLDLKEKDVFLETEVNDTRYFSVTGIPSTLSYGKHPFSITFNDPEGQPLLKNLSNIVFEFVDSRGTVIFSDLLDIEELSGAGNGVLWIKKDPLRTAAEIADGPVYLYVMGELDGDEIPEEWKGIYNVRSTFVFDARKDYPNTSNLVLKNPLGIQTNLSISESIELDTASSIFKRSFINVSLTNLDTDGGKIESVELAYNEQKAKTDEYEVITRYPLVSGSYEVTDQDKISGLNPITNTTKIITPKQFRRDTSVRFRLRFLNPAGQLAQHLDEDRQGEVVEVTSSFITFEGSPHIVEKEDNLLKGSMFTGNAVGKGFEQSGKNSAFLKTVDYTGFLSASLGKGSPGILFYSGSILTSSGDNYNGVGLELHGGQGSGSFRFSTDPNLLEITADTFFVGASTSQFISGSGGNIEISSSDFHLTSEGIVTASAILLGDKTAGQFLQFDDGALTVQGSITADSIRTPASIGGAPSTDQNASSSISAGGFATFKSASIGGFTISPTDISASGLVLKSSGQITGSTTLIGDKGAGQFLQFDDGSLTVQGDITANAIRTPSSIGGSPSTAANASSSIDSQGFASFKSASIGGFTVDDTEISASGLVFKSGGQMTGSSTLIGNKAGGNFLQFVDDTLTVQGDITANAIRTPATIGGVASTDANASASITSDGLATFKSGSIAGWQIFGNVLSGSNVSLDSQGAALFKSDQGPGSDTSAAFDILRDEYYIDFTPADQGNSTNYYVKFGPNFAVDSTGVLHASGAVFEGTITASAGLIGGFNTDEVAFTSTNIFISGSPLVGGLDDDKYMFISTSNFNVKENGDITASAANITGDITANTITANTAGTIANFTINSSEIKSSNENLRLKSNGQITGSDVLFDGGTIGGFIVDGHSLTSTGVEINNSSQTLFISSSNFKVKHDGVITGSQVDFTGGTIGGFTLTSNSVSSSNGNLRLKDSGQITGSNVLFSGGKIAGFDISGTKLQQDGSFHLDGDASSDFFISSSRFQVTPDGDVSGSQVLFTGGKIGGFTLSDTEISSSGLLLESTGKISGSNVFFTGGTVGGFTITDSVIRNNNDTVALSSTLPGLLIKDGGGTNRVLVKSGSLSTVGGGTQYIGNKSFEDDSISAGRNFVSSITSWSFAEGGGVNISLTDRSGFVDDDKAVSGDVTLDVVVPAGSSNYSSNNTYELVQVITASIAQGDTLSFSSVARFSSSFGGRGKDRALGPQYFRLEYSGSDTDGFVPFLPQADFTASNGYGEYFLGSGQYSSFGASADLPGSAEFIKVILTGSINDDTGFSIEKPLFAGDKGTVNSELKGRKFTKQVVGSATAEFPETEITFDNFSVRSNTRRVEVTQEGILIYNSEDSFFKMTGAGIELRGGSGVASFGQAINRESFTNDSQVAGTLGAPSLQAYQADPEDIGTTASDGNVVDYAKGNHVHRITFSTINSVLSGQTLTNVFNGTFGSSAGVLISGSFTNVSSSISTRLTDITSSINRLTSASGSFSTRVTTLEQQDVDDDLTIAGDTGGNLTIDMDSETLTIAGGNGITTNGVGNTITIDAAEGVVSSSAQIATDISGSFVAASSSISTRLTTEEGNIDTLQGRDLVAGNGLTGGGTLASDRTFNVGEGTGISVGADAISTNDSEIVHDNLSGFVANEHINHSSVTLTAGTGLTGGGDITTNRTFAIDFTDSSFKSAVSGSYKGDGVISGSAQIATDISGSFTAASSSFSSRVTTLEATDTDDDLTVAGDSGGNLSIDLDSETLTIAGGTGIDTSGNTNTITVTTNDSEIVHDDLSGFVTNEHIDHSTVSVIAGDGLTGGGTIAANRTLNIGAGTGIDVAADAISVDVSDFMSNGSNNRIVTATGTDAMNAEANLTFDGTTLSGTSATASFGHVVIQSPGDALELRSSGPVNTAGNTVSIDFTTNVYPTAGRNAYIDASQDSSNRGKLTIGTYGTVGGSTAFYDILQIHAQDGNAVISGSSISTGSFGVTQTEGIRGLAGVYNNGEVLIPDTLKFGADTDSMLRRRAANDVEFRLGNTDIFRVHTSGVYVETGNLEVQSGNIEASGNISGSSTSTGSFGHLKLDGAAAGNVTGHLVPSADGTYDLGTTNSQDWRNIYARHIDLSNSQFTVEVQSSIVHLNDHAAIGNGFRFSHRNTKLFEVGDSNNRPVISGSSTSTGSFGHVFANGTIHGKRGSSGATVHPSADEAIFENSANAGISILSGNSNEAAVYFGDSDDNDVGRVRYDHSDDTMDLITGAAVRATVAATKTTFTQTQGIELINTGNNTVFHIPSSAGYTFGTLTNNHMSMWTNNTERVRILNSGNVGIGTTSPGAKLEVIGDISGSASSTGSFGAGHFADKLGIGTVSIPHGGVGGGRLSINGADSNVPNGPALQMTTDSDNYPLFSVLPYAHDNIAVYFDGYNEGGGNKSSDAGSTYRIHKVSDELRFGVDSGVSAGSTATYENILVFDTSKNIEIGGNISGSSSSTGSFGALSIGDSDPTAGHGNIAHIEGKAQIDRVWVGDTHTGGTSWGSLNTSADDLVVDGGASSGISILSTATGKGTLNFNNYNDADYSWIRFDANAAHTTFKVAGTEDVLQLTTTKISGSSTSTGSFGRVEASAIDATTTITTPDIFVNAGTGLNNGLFLKRTGSSNGLLFVQNAFGNNSVNSIMSLDNSNTGNGTGQRIDFTFSSSPYISITGRKEIDSYGGTAALIIKHHRSHVQPDGIGFARFTMFKVSEALGGATGYTGTGAAAAAPSFYVSTGSIYVETGNVSGSSTSTGSFGALRIGSDTSYVMAHRAIIGHGDTNDGITLQSGATHQGNIAFNHSNGTTAHGRISYQHNTNYMSFFTNNSERIRIDTNGNLISYGGNISGSSTSTGSFGSLVVANKVNSNLRLAGANILYFGDDNNYIQDVGSYLKLRVADGHYFAIHNDSGDTERFRINDNGRVGIGTNSPDNVLHVSTGDNVVAKFESTDANATLYLVDNNTSNASTFKRTSNDLKILENGGNVLFPGTNVKVSGSSTSTGSFGLVLQNGQTLAVGQSVGTTDDVTFNNITATGDISGSATSTGSFAKLELTSNITGSDVFTVDGLNGRLFTVTDEMSGSIFSANLISGLPVIEAFSDNRVNLGPFSSPIQIDSSGNISGSSISTGSFGHVKAATSVFTNLIENVAGSSLKIKAGGNDVILDTGDNDIQLHAGGSEFARLTNDSNTLAIKSSTSNADIVLNGVDSGANITALRLDMSEKGKAIFNSDVSGSSTSTGSFGDGRIAGRLGVQTTTPRGPIDVKGSAGTQGFYVSDYGTAVYLPTDIGHSGGAGTFDLQPRNFRLGTSTGGAVSIYPRFDKQLNLGTTDDTDLLVLSGSTKISGSATSTGSFGNVEILGSALPTKVGANTLNISNDDADSFADLQIAIQGSDHMGMVMHEDGTARAGVYYDNTPNNLVLRTNANSFRITNADNQFSGSASSTGSFGKVATDMITPLASNGTITLQSTEAPLRIKRLGSSSYLFGPTSVISGESTLSIYPENNGSGINLRGKNSSGTLQTGLLVDADGNTRFYGNKVSGSATSTGSFGMVHTEGIKGLNGNYTGTLLVPEILALGNDTDTMLRKYTSNVLEFRCGGQDLIRFDGNNGKVIAESKLEPDADDTYNLGASDKRWKDVFAVQTTTGGVFETGLKTEKIGDNPTGTIVSWRGDGLVPCDSNEDELVMGVIKEGKDEPIVMGAEPVLVTGKVEVGDYIVTSDKIGHGKSVKRGYLLKKDLFGKVIAQALESCDGDSNLIKCMIRKM